MRNRKRAKKGWGIFLYFCLVLPPATVSAQDTLPPIPENSAFTDQIDLEVYPSLPPPLNPVRLRWDFSGTNEYPFDFSQEIIMENMNSMFAHKTGETTRQIITGHGKLSLKSEGNNIARLVLEDMVMQMNANNGGEGKDMQTRAPAMVIQGVRENGNMEIGDSSQELLFKTLFPIPPVSLKIGESVRIPARMPFNAMGSLLHVTGHFTITLVDYVQVNGKECVKLATDIDIADLDVPPELEGSYEVQVQGGSVFFFNVEDRHFMSGRVAMLMSMRVEAPATVMDVSEEVGGDFPDKVEFAMDSDNFIELEYIGD